MTVIQTLGIDPKKLGGLEDYILTFSILMYVHGHRSVYVFEKEPHHLYIKVKLSVNDCQYFIHEQLKWIYVFFCTLNFLIQIIRKYRPDILQRQFHHQSHYATLIGFPRRLPTYFRRLDPRIADRGVAEHGEGKYLLYFIAKRFLHNGVSIEKYSTKENVFSIRTKEHERK